MNGRYRVGIKTSEKKLKQKRQAVKEWLRMRMHRPIDETMKLLNQKLVGHCRYYAVNGNLRKVNHFYDYVKRRVMYMMRGRSQKDRTSWDKLQRIWDYYILAPKIMVQIWSSR